jgi:hypothetical protein
VKHEVSAEVRAGLPGSVDRRHVEGRNAPRVEKIVAAREALIAAIRSLAPVWNDTLEQHWRTAITSIVVPMLEGAAVDTAVWAERLATGVPEID